MPIIYGFSFRDLPNLVFDDLIQKIISLMIRKNSSKIQNKLNFLNDKNIWGIKPEVKRDLLANQRKSTQENWRLNNINFV